MSIRSLTLAQLLGPHTQQDFISRFWERQPLHLKRSRPDYYESLMTVAQLEGLLSSPDTRYPAVQLSKAGTYLPPETFTEAVKLGSDTLSGVLNLQKLNAEYRAGATVVMPGLQRTCKPLAALCADIDSRLNHVAHANAYLTPGNTRGFTPHYDTHEVLVLQLAGKKRWRVYPPPLELPHRKQPFSPLGYTVPDTPLLELELEPGDLLYLPRGYVHTTTTSAASSAHLTIGIAVYTWVDLAGELLQTAIRSPQLRRALPPGFASTPDRSELVAHFSTLLAHLYEGADAAVLLEAFIGRLGSTTAEPDQGFRSNVIVVQPDTVLKAPDPDTYRIVSLGTRVAIEYQQRRFVLPHEVLPLLATMRAQPAFTAEGLPAAVELDTRLALVRTLVDTGFLTLAHQAT